MKIPFEIIILFFILSFLIYTMPTLLVKFSRTLKGKFLLLALMIVITLYNKTGGLIMAMFIIFLTEFNYESNNGLIYEGFTGKQQIDDGSLQYILDTNALAKRLKQDQLTVEQSLLPVDSATIS